MSRKDFDHRLRITPEKPGVYIMKDARDKVLYVGKASSLKNRIRSYFGSPNNLAPKIQRMVSRVADYEFIVTDSEAEALILECTLIKKYRPPYNTRLKDDKTYPYIKIDLAEDFPQVYITRRVAQDGARYFGPFATSGSVRKTLDLLKKLFPYRSCTKVITGKDPRPCLEYYINRCVAPCIGAVTSEEYHKVTQQVIMFMEGKTERVVDDIRKRMEESSEDLEFERAAVLRDQIHSIQQVMEEQRIKVASSANYDLDAIAMAEGQDEAWVEVFFIRQGKLIGRDHFMMEGTQDDPPGHILAEFIKQFYQSASFIPPRIILQYPLEEEKLIQDWLKEKRGASMALARPLRGEQHKLIKMVAENAAQGLTQMRAKWLSNADAVQQAMAELQEELSLSKVPSRIECYDISNIQGTNAVGSMVTFQDGLPKPAHYRRFRIKTIESINDYAMMQEVLRRRFKRMAALKGKGNPPNPPLARGGQEGFPLSPLEEGSQREEDIHPHPFDKLRAGSDPLPSRERESLTPSPSPIGRGVTEGRGEGFPITGEDSWGIIPDLVLIDGGKGHLSAALEVFLELGIDFIPLASIAKENEWLFVPQTPEPIVLPANSQSLYLVQRIRDEAHRFAITYHRKLRSKASIASSVDLVPGIGPKRKRMLMRRFGSIKGIKDAAIDDIASVPGMTRSLAVRLKESL